MTLLAFVVGLIFGACLGFLAVSLWQVNRTERLLEAAYQKGIERGMEPRLHIEDGYFDPQKVKAWFQWEAKKCPPKPKEPENILIRDPPLLPWNMIKTWWKGKKKP